MYRALFNNPSFEHGVHLTVHLVFMFIRNRTRGDPTWFIIVLQLNVGREEVTVTYIFVAGGKDRTVFPTDIL